MKPIENQTPHYLSLQNRNWQNPKYTYSSNFINFTEEFLTIKKQSPDEFEFSPELKNIASPFQFKDAEKAAELIGLGIINSKRFLVWGDFDVDGVSSCTLITEFLKQIHSKPKNVNFHIPHRINEGYGLNNPKLEELKIHNDILITTDCGTTATEEIKFAKQLGYQVIIIDHHKSEDELPPADALVNPHRKDNPEAIKILCAAGVAFMVIMLARKYLRDNNYFNNDFKEPDLRESLDLVGLATVADMMPLIGINRLFVKKAIERLKFSPRLGFKALMEIAAINHHHLQSSDFGFKIGPRINAQGRMGDATLGVQILMSKNILEAQEIAKTLNNSNLKRRQTQLKVYEEAKESALALIEDFTTTHERSPSLIICHNKEWHPGVLGLAASRISKECGLPTIILGDKGKGSGRSISKINLYDSMYKGKHLCESFGGHSQAAGVKLNLDNFQDYYDLVEKTIYEEYGPGPYIQDYKPDFKIEQKDLNFQLLKNLEQFAPFGMGFTAPLFEMNNVDINQAKFVGQEHLKFKINNKLSCIFFGALKLFNKVGIVHPIQHISSHKFSVLGHLEKNIYNDTIQIQFKVLDIKIFN